MEKTRNANKILVRETSWKMPTAKTGKDVKE
jgi:hypothetical protein